MRTFLRIVLKPLSFLPAIFMMYLIFGFSAQDADTSSQLSYKVSHKIIEIGADVIDADFEEWEIDSLASRFHGPIRKIAHMTEYFALAVSVAFPLYVYGLRGILLIIVAGFFCVAFACGDEYHQSRVAGRSPSRRDVVIDSIGIFAGIIFTRIVGWTGRKTIFRPLTKKKKKRNDSQCRNSTVPSSKYPPHYNDTASYTEKSAFSNSPASYNGSAPYNGNVPYHENAPYNGNAFYNKNAPYNSSTPYHANVPYNSNAPYHANVPYNGSTPYHANVPYNSNAPYNPNVPYNGRAPYNPNVPYNGRAPYNNNPSYYNGSNYNGSNNNVVYNSSPSSDSQYRPLSNAVENPDTLSEDMSFRKLIHEIKDQKKTVHTEKHTAKKPKLDGKDMPDDFADLYEINLNSNSKPDQ